MYRPVQSKSIVWTTPVLIIGEDPPYTPQHFLQWNLMRKAESIIYCWERKGMIKEAASTCNSPIEVESQPSGKVMIVFDYHDLNQCTHNVPANNMNRFNAIGRIPLGRYYATFKLFYGNWNIPLDKATRYKTAFTFNFRQYIWTRLPDSFKNTTVILHNTLGQVLDRLPSGIRTRVTHYVDSLLVSASTKAECTFFTNELIDHLEQEGFEIQWNSLRTCRHTVEYLGRQFFEGGIKLTESYLEQIENLPSPTSVRELRSILGLLNDAARHTPWYSKLRKSLNMLLRRGYDWWWGFDEETALRNLIDCVLENRLAVNGLRPGEQCTVELFVEEEDWMADIVNSKGKPYISLGGAFTWSAQRKNTDYRINVAMGEVWKRAADVLEGRPMAWQVITEEDSDY